MLKSSLFLLSPFILTACVDTDSALPLTCTEAGKSPVNIFYGDSQLRVEPSVVKVKKNKMIEFRLNPIKAAKDPAGVDYDVVEVTIAGKNEAGQWLNASGKGKSTTLQVCAPAPNTLTTYEYMVIVQEVGQLDPRAEVDPD
jgi:hypothetical protein